MRVPRIRRACAVKGLAGWYADDKQAIIEGAPPDGYVYQGNPVTPGFQSIREPGEALLITLEGEGGSFGEGDCVSVTYAGSAGRQGPFHAEAYLEAVHSILLPRLVGAESDSFRSAAAELESLCEAIPSAHPAISYGISQALLNLTASAADCTITEVICEEYGLPLPKRAVPIAIQTGDDRHLGADKAILKRADVLPHGLFKTEEDLGAGGERLIEYARWLKHRIHHLAGAEYIPILHFDVYGTLGKVFGNDLSRVASFLIKMEKMVEPYKLQVESPIEMDTQCRQIDNMVLLRRHLHKAGATVQVIADEWCNTIEDIQAFSEAGACDLVHIKMPDLGSVARSVEACLYCRSTSTGAYLGGTCNETIVSAQISVDIALATCAEQVLAKPGMGVDEALMLTKNRMARVLAKIRHQSCSNSLPHKR